MTTTFKSYSEKSKAARALVQVYSISKDATGLYMAQGSDGRWGFTLNDEGAPMSVGLHHATDSPNFGAERTVAAAALPTEAEVQALAPQADVTPGDPAYAIHSEGGMDVDDTGTSSDYWAPAASAFAGFAMSQLCPTATEPAAASPAPAQAEQATKGLRIEKDREERNGVKMRSTGGACRQVWDALQSMMLHDEATGVASIPTVADIKKLATEKGWNVNNASIEYYQWRKFHGITGRGKKTV
jgi:hypothetical protein